MLGLFAAFFALVSGLSWLLTGEGRRYLGLVGMVLAGLLAILTIEWCTLVDKNPILLAAGIVASLLLGSLGYWAHRRASRKPPDEPMLAMSSEPSPSDEPCQPQTQPEAPTTPTRKAGSRCSSLFVPRGRFGHGGRAKG
jgi:hypothetical protein